MTIYSVRHSFNFIIEQLVNFPLVKQLSSYITLLLEEIIDGKH